MNAEVRGNLQQRVNRYSTPSGNTLTLRDKVGSVRRESGSSGGLGLAPTGCIPVTATGQQIAPKRNPYHVGDDITVRPENLSGSPSIAFQWFVQGALRGTSEVLHYTLTSADFPDPTPGSTSTFVINLIMTNECSSGQFQLSVNYQGQQDP